MAELVDADDVLACEGCVKNIVSVDGSAST